MDEIALNILDIAYNSIRAHASLIEIRIFDSTQSNIIDLSIKDNGDGMDQDTVLKVTDPFSHRVVEAGRDVALVRRFAPLACS